MAAVADLQSRLSRHRCCQQTGTLWESELSWCDDGGDVDPPAGQMSRTVVAGCN